MSKKVPYKSIVCEYATNHRAINPEFVQELKASMLQKVAGKSRGLLEEIKCVFTVRPGDDGMGEEVWLVVDGMHRYTALELLRNSTDPDEVAAFEEIVSNGKLSINETAGDAGELRDTAVISNTHRQKLTPYEYYLEAVKRSQYQDQYEIASVLRIQQPRVAELLSFQKLIPEIHDAWRAGELYTHDLVQFVTLDDDAQAAAFKAFSAQVQAAGGSKKEARKALKADVKAKGKKREYANTGKPSRQTLAGFVPHVYVRAHTAKTAKERDFYNALAAAFKVMNGELTFEKLSISQTYVTVKEASAAEQALAEAEAKAAAKAEKAAKKASKPKKAKAPKPPKAEKPAKASKAPKAEKPKKEKAAKAPKAEKPKKEKAAKAPKAPKKPKK